MTKDTTAKKKPPGWPSSKHVVAEIRRRRKAGHALHSSANRGDWLYAASVRRFGSRGAAVNAAGYDYDEVRQVALTEAELRHQASCHCINAQGRRTPLTKDEVLQYIRRHAAQGRLSPARREHIVVYDALRHFGSWTAAVEAAGLDVQRFSKWTPEAVVARIREDLRHGLSVYASDVIEREETLYQAGRRRFGSWGAALKAADPSLPEPRQGRPKRPPAVLSRKQPRRSR